MACERDTAKQQWIEMVALPKPATATCFMYSPLSITALPTVSKTWYDSIEKCFFTETFATNTSTNRKNMIIFFFLRQSKGLI